MVDNEATLKTPTLSLKIMHTALSLLFNPLYFGIGLVTSFILALSPSGYLGLLSLVYIGLKQEPDVKEEVRQRFKKAILGQYLPLILLCLLEFTPQGYPIGVSGMIHWVSISLTYLVCLQMKSMKNHRSGVWESSIELAEAIKGVALSMPITSILKVILVIYMSIACDFFIHLAVLLTASDVNNYRLLWALIVCLKMIPITFIVSYGIAIITNNLNRKNTGEIDKCH